MGTLIVTTVAVFIVNKRDIASRLPAGLDESRVVRLRGLPYEITQEGIREFRGRLDWTGDLDDMRTDR